MRRRLLKYEIDATNGRITQIVSGRGLRPVAVGWQDTKLVVWAEGRAAGDNHDGELPEHEHEYEFMAVWTGGWVPDGAWNYVGSAQRHHQELGFFVVHVYYGGML